MVKYFHSFASYSRLRSPTKKLDYLSIKGLYGFLQVAKTFK